MINSALETETYYGSIENTIKVRIGATGSDRK